VANYINISHRGN